MAQSQVFDIGAMHKVGYASAGGIRRYKQQRGVSALERFAFQFLGNQVNDYAKSARDRREGFRNLNEIQSADMFATIKEDPFTQNEDVSSAIQEFSDMRDEGQRLVSKYHGFAKSKKYKKGVEMMNQAQAKLTNLQGDLQGRLTYKNKARSIELNGYYIDENGEKVEASWDAMNEDKVDNRTMALMTGELDKSFVVNRETGRLELLEENWDNVSAMPGSVGKKQIVDPEITKTPWNELKLNKMKDKTKMLGLSTAAMELGSGYGTSGIEWSNTLQTGIYDQARQQLGGLGRDGFKSWFFGGTHYDFANGGKTFTTPAGAFVEKRLGFDPGTAEYKGALEQLKGTDLDEGDLYKEFAVEHYVDVAKHHHEIGLAAFNKKNAKTSKVTKPTVFELQKIENLTKGINMLKGENVQYDDNSGGMMRYNSDGKGMTKVYVRTSEPKLDKDDNEIGTNYGWDLIEEIPTNQALKQRNLDIDIPGEYLYPPEYTTGKNPSKPIPGLIDYSQFKNPTTNASKFNK